jgi:hypothetical protein
MNHEIHEAHEKRAGADHCIQWQTPAGKPAVPGNALSFRVFGVFRGFNCFLQDYSNHESEV